MTIIWIAVERNEALESRLRGNGDYLDCRRERNEALDSRLGRNDY